MAAFPQLVEGAQVLHYCLFFSSNFHFLIFSLLSFQLVGRTSAAPLQARLGNPGEGFCRQLWLGDHRLVRLGLGDGSSSIICHFDTSSHHTTTTSIRSDEKDAWGFEESDVAGRRIEIQINIFRQGTTKTHLAKVYKRVGRAERRALCILCGAAPG